MASKGKGKSKIKKNQTEFEGRIIDLQRLAYDVLVFAASKFRLPSKNICEWDGVENDYGRSDFILVLSRLFLKYQITQRDVWYEKFKSRYDSTKFKTFDDARYVLQEVFQMSVEYAKQCYLHKTIIYLSVINEFIIFLHSERCKLYVKELARFWFQYVSPIKKDFEKAGGLTQIYKIYNLPKFHYVDLFYDKFIPENCLSYSDHERLFRNFHDASERYFRDLQGTLSRKENLLLELVLRKTIWEGPKPEDIPRPTVPQRVEPEVVPQLEEKVQRSRKNTEPDCVPGVEIPENDGLGILPHEVLLLYSGVPVDDGATSPNQSPGATPEGKERVRTRSSGQKRERVRTGSYRQMKAQQNKLQSEQAAEKDYGQSQGSPSQEKTKVPQGSPNQEKLSVLQGSPGQQKAKVPQGSPNQEKLSVLQGSPGQQKAKVPQGSPNQEKLIMLQGSPGQQKAKVPQGSPNQELSVLQESPSHEKAKVPQESPSHEKAKVPQESPNQEKTEVPQGSLGLEKETIPQGSPGHEKANVH